MHELKIVRERREGYGKSTKYSSAASVYLAFQPHFEKLDREQFVVILLDAKNVHIGFNVVSVGSLTSSLVHPREVFKPVVLYNDAVQEQYDAKEMAKGIGTVIVRRSAAAIILAHNHPSGDPCPSAEDLQITKRLREIGELMGVRVLDHIIFGDNRYVSFVDDGYWDT